MPPKKRRAQAKRASLSVGAASVQDDSVDADVAVTEPASRRSSVGVSVPTGDSDDDDDDNVDDVTMTDDDSAEASVDEPAAGHCRHCSRTDQRARRTVIRTRPTLTRCTRTNANVCCRNRPLSRHPSRRRLLCPWSDVDVCTLSDRKPEAQVRAVPASQSPSQCRSSARRTS